MKRTVSDFLGGFVRPLVAGGDVHVSRPISEPELELFIRDLGESSVEQVEIDDARQRVISNLVVDPPTLLLGEDELYLAAALHNLLFLVHPDAETWAITRGMEGRVVDTARTFARRPMSRDRRKVLARHGLLHNLFSIVRQDVTVKWWTGRARFVGQLPPQRLTRWRGVRRVTEERELADFRDLFGHEAAVPIVYSALRRSPLTLLLSPTQVGASLRWEEVGFLLRDPELARAAAYRVIAEAEPRDAVASAAAYAVALEQMLERRPPEQEVRVVCAFLVHLATLFALSEARQRDARHSVLLNAILGGDSGALRPKGVATFFALANALAAIGSELAEVPGLESDAALAQRWHQHRAQVSERLGDGLIESLAVRLERHLGGRSEVAASPA